MTHSFDAVDLYNVFEVSIKFRDRLCGGVPKNPELIKGWIKAKTGYDDAITTAQTEEAIATMIDTETEKSWNGFPSDENGLFIWSRQVKALFKEAATMLRFTTSKLGSKQIFQHGFEIKGKDIADRIYLGKSEADGSAEGPIHVQTAQGPRTALKRVDYVTRGDIQFEVWILKTEPAEKRHISESDLVKMLTFGQENGIGADRSQGHGKFDVVHFAKREVAKAKAA